MPHKVVTEEVELLARVTDFLEREQRPKPTAETSVEKELDSLQQMIADGADPKDAATLSDQFLRQQAILRQLRDARQTMEVDPRSPYFGHLRLKEEKEEWDLVLGKATKIQGDIRIVDWRNAPISKVFYRYQQGDEFEEMISGRLRTGEVTARRTVTIRDGKLERVTAPEGVFTADANAPEGWRELSVEEPHLTGGQGAAMRVYDRGEGLERRLGTDQHGRTQRADKHLPDIAGLIDPEQFQLITRASSGMVVIRGTAGSGKTTVALHRIAYLSFDDPKIDSDKTLVVVFSPALRSYVSHVLPALGVTKVRVVTFRQWAEEQCKRLFPMLPPATRETAPAVVQRMKNHPVYLRALQEHIERNPAPGNVKTVVDDWGSVLSRKDLLAEIVERDAPGSFSDAELDRITAWCNDRHRELIDWLNGDEEIEPLLDVDDSALLLRGWQLRVGPLTTPNGQILQYRHVVIDEVQDFSPLEVRILFECLDERTSMTLSGDTQQHVMQDAGFTSWDDFFRYLGIPGTMADTLRISYRSSREVVDFAQTVLGPLREDDTPPVTTRTGPPVELFRFTDHGAGVVFLADTLKELMRKEPLASVVILTPNKGISADYYRGLNNCEVPELRHIEDQEFSFTPGIDVTEIDQVKGLEFDYVILIEVSSTNFPDTPAARRLLHVGATRAIHQLWLTSVGTPSPMVREALAAAK